MLKNILFLFLFSLIVSCNSTSSITDIGNYYNKTEKFNSDFFTQKVQSINSYVSNVDSKSNDIVSFSANHLKIDGNKRNITENESIKKIILKNNSIVKVRYKEHLQNNLINSKEFYYNNDSLVCIKLNHISPNHLNQAILYQRVIYVKDKKTIADSDEFNSQITSNELVSIGLKSLKDEYHNLN
jgi:hypothetical protein